MLWKFCWLTSKTRLWTKKFSKAFIWIVKSFHIKNIMTLRNFPKTWFKRNPMTLTGNRQKWCWLSWHLLIFKYVNDANDANNVVKAMMQSLKLNKDAINKYLKMHYESFESLKMHVALKFNLAGCRINIIVIRFLSKKSLNREIIFDVRHRVNLLNNIY